MSNPGNATSHATTRSVATSGVPDGRSGLPWRAGVGLKPQHFLEVLATRPDVGFFEVHAENYMVDGGPFHHFLGQVREHYAQIPVMVIAPTAGMVFTAWVLWGAVPNRYLVLGVAAVSTLSVLRLLLYRRYDSPRGAATPQAVWARLAVVAALLSGCLWGSAAPLLYPPIHSEYDVYLLVLLTLVPIVPVAALAVYMPAFYAYYFPCMAPFIVTLALQPTRAERVAEILAAHGERAATLPIALISLLTILVIEALRFLRLSRVGAIKRPRPAALVLLAVLSLGLAGDLVQHGRFIGKRDELLAEISAQFSLFARLDPPPGDALARDEARFAPHHATALQITRDVVAVNARGVARLAALGIEADALYDLDLTPNRPDALSVIGIARDVAAQLGLTFRLPGIELAPALADAASLASISISDPGLCGRFTARVLSGVPSGSSPEWMQRRLALCGMRPISAVVDVSNYVMLELGQPNHPYDLATVAGGADNLATAASSTASTSVRTCRA